MVVVFIPSHPIHPIPSHLLPDEPFPYAREKVKLTLISQPLHIQHGDLDPPLRQPLHDDLPNPIAPSRHNHHLPPPIIPIIHPIVRDRVIEPVRDALQDAQRRRDAQVLVEPRVLGGEARAVGVVARGEEERDGEEGVEDRVFEGAAEGVCCDAWWRVSIWGEDDGEGGRARVGDWDRVMVNK